MILILATQLIKAISDFLTRKKNLRRIGVGLSAGLTEHAKATVKGMSGVMGYYQGKGAKATDKQIGGMAEIIEQIKPFADLLGNGEGKGMKKDGWL